MFIDEFVVNKRRFNNMLPLTFAKDIRGNLIPVSLVVKLSTQCFDSLSIAGFMRFGPEEDMYIVTDLKGTL